MKNKIFAFIPVLGFILLNGCYFGASVDNLLTPPDLSEEQSAIRGALVSAIGENFNLIYPKNGEYRSPYVLQDIGGSPEPEALVFYESPTETDAAAVRINVLEKIQGEWRSVFDTQGSGTGVENIFISKLGDDNLFVVVGFGMPANERYLKIYGFRGSKLETLYEDYYSRMLISEVGRDNTLGLVILHPNANGRTASAGYVQSVDGTPALVSSVAMNPETTEFSKVLFGKVAENTNAVFIDGLTAGGVLTEVVYSINGSMRNPLFVNNPTELQLTLRSQGYLSADIDSDGIVEIPSLSFFQGYTADSPIKEYLTAWNVFENYSIIKKYSSYVDLENRYCFILPSRWENVVTLKTDETNGEKVFYKYDINLERSTQELLRFAVSDSKNYTEKLNDGYRVLNAEGAYMLYKSSDDGKEPLTLTETEIVNNFHIIR